MPKRMFYLSALLLASQWLSLRFDGLAVGQSFEAIHAFGDSMTDTGNNPAPAPDYFQGRYSNGPLWIEYFSSQLGMVYDPAHNYAQSGAETSEVRQQVQQLVAPANAAGSLFVVWAGGNDFIHNFGQGLNDPFWNGLIAQSVANLSNAVSVLYADGARWILVPNQVDLSRLPLVLDSGLPFFVQTYLRGKVDQFNTALAAALMAIANTRSDLKLITPDIHAKFTNLLVNLGTYGFTQADPDALDDPQLSDQSFAGPGKDYLFWDPIHPTTKAHLLVAQWFYQALPATPQKPQLTIAASGSTLQLTLTNLQVSQAYTVQTSTNLSTWADVTTINATNSLQQWSTSVGSSPQNYFRLKFQ